MMILAGFAVGCASGPRAGDLKRPDASATTSPARSLPKAMDETGEKYQKGLSYLDQGRLEDAQSVLASLIRSHPDNVEVHNALGVLYRKRGMLNDAIGEYRKAIALSEKLAKDAPVGEPAAELYNNLAIAHRESGEFRKAEEAYRKAITINPKFSPAYYNLGVLYDLYLDQPHDALRYYREYEGLTGKNQTVDVWIADLEQRTAREDKHEIGQP